MRDKTSNAILPVAIKGVRLTIGGKALIDDLDVMLEAGTRSVVLGPNGAGKSLFLRLIHGLIEPSAGTIEWCGPGAADAARRQALVFQRPVMLRRSAAANIDYALRLRGLSKIERKRRISDVLERTGLSSLANRPARVLSIGEQQRLALARAWALLPDVLLLDEPTANLDPTATREVEKIIHAIHDSGAKIVMTTHDMGQARRIADEVLFMYKGRLVEHTLAAQFFQTPETKEARAFLQGELLW